MGITPQPGWVFGGYKINRMLNKGMMADSFKATDQATKKSVFLKAYHSPGPRSEWYDAYRQYMDDLNARLVSSSVKDFCLCVTKAFVCNPAPDFCDEEFFYQAYEYIENGQDLGQLLGKGPKDLKIFSWAERVQLAREFVYAMSMLHGENIVHSDLKPDNIMLLPGDGGTHKWIPRLIDMDRSIMEDRTAPWHGFETYAGTPGYKSPEHLQEGIPGVDSDVFTTGIILCELLAGVHPFDWTNIDEDEYAERVLAGRHMFTQQPLTLLGAFEDDADTGNLARLILECFAVSPGDRPSDAEIYSALNHPIKEGEPESAATAQTQPASAQTPPSPGQTQPPPSGYPWSGQPQTPAVAQYPWSQQQPQRQESPYPSWNQQQAPRQETPHSSWGQQQAPRQETPHSSWGQQQAPRQETSYSSWDQQQAPRQETSYSSWDQQQAPRQETSYSSWGQQQAPRQETPYSPWGQQQAPQQGTWPQRTAGIPVPPPPPNKKIKLYIEGDLGRARIGMDGSYGSSFFGRISVDAGFCSDYQYQFRRKDSGWYVFPVAKAKNQSILNGSPIPESGVRLKDGDVLCVESRTNHNQGMRTVVKLVEQA